MLKSRLQSQKAHGLRHAEHLHNILSAIVQLDWWIKFTSAAAGEYDDWSVYAWREDHRVARLLPDSEVQKRGPCGGYY